MVIDLYYIPWSAPCRAVQMLARALGIKLNLKIMSLLTENRSKSNFIQFNTPRIIPTLVDDGFTICESRAILVYLVEKYGGQTTLYPSDPLRRAIVQQRLYFDMGTLYQLSASTYYFDIVFKEAAKPDNLKKVEEALGLLNTFLHNQNYVAGRHLTIADISLIATVSTIEVIDVDINKFPNVKEWVEKAKRTVPGYDINEAGLADFKRFIKSKRQT